MSPRALSFRSNAALMFERAMTHNVANVRAALAEVAPVGRLLDIGCDDGERTEEFARAAGAGAVFGVESEADAAAAARERGIDVAVADLGDGLPYDDDAFDAVVSNQVIEHLHDTDLFASEVARVLAPGGTAVISTENLASWHNIAALVLGWQPFSLTNVTSSRTGLGNPAAVHRGVEHTRPASWQHVRVFSYRGLSELFAAYGLDVVRVDGAGYYPLPTRVARRDPRHAAFITVVARKPASRTPR